MIYTYQALIVPNDLTARNDAPPCTDVKYAYSKDELKQAALDWGKECSKSGIELELAGLVAWKGAYNDVTGMVPDIVSGFGPRGGVILSDV